ncbi:MAG: hypothetical protein JRJ39_00500 [Deltaproteobacteria bacterium]|nr:hypothetical protein [Deltaproteobacteria bacterium]MBW1845589.1 hypothetical protein [Deltaproteobacteria bacterium]MBW2032017.1 hypothetical protein [Deltaproteobacteria bacterium]
MIAKVCRRCGKTKTAKEFYRHKEMADGYLNFCKTCTRKRVAKHRNKNIDQIREYDRNRAKKPHRRQHITENTRVWRAKNPKGYRAQNKLNNAIRDGKIQRQPCRICGKVAHGHHPDYDKPLDVDWLCAKHHKQYA